MCYSFNSSMHSRPQSPSFLGHVVGKRGVGYKFSRVALGTRMLIYGKIEQVFTSL